MGNVTGFIDIKRTKPRERPIHLRLLDWNEVYLPAAEAEVRDQGARCMDCGIPFCHQGCPLGNQIPDWNDLVYRQRWRAASDRLHATNNFPDFTGRLCPAPCEGSCVLGIHDEAVTIKNIELSIVERAFTEGWIQPAASGRAHRAERGHRRIRPGRSGRRRSAQSGRTCGDGLRTRSAAGRTPALRDSRVQTREARARQTTVASRARGRRLPHRRQHWR